MSQLSTIRQRLNALDGWHRLFVALVLLWSVPLSPAAVFVVNTTQRDYRIVEDSPEAKILRDREARYAEFLAGKKSPRHEALAALDGVTPDEAHRELIRRAELKVSRAWVWEFHPVLLCWYLLAGLVVWSLPVAVVYGVARLFGWVVCGFRAS